MYGIEIDGVDLANRSSPWVLSRIYELDVKINRLDDFSLDLSTISANELPSSYTKGFIDLSMRTGRNKEILDKIISKLKEETHGFDFTRSSAYIEYIKPRILLFQNMLSHNYIPLPFVYTHSHIFGLGSFDSGYNRSNRINFHIKIYEITQDASLFSDLRDYGVQIANIEDTLKYTGNERVYVSKQLKLAKTPVSNCLLAPRVIRARDAFTSIACVNKDFKPSQLDVNRWLSPSVGAQGSFILGEGGDLNNYFLYLDKPSDDQIEYLKSIKRYHIFR